MATAQIARKLAEKSDDTEKLANKPSDSDNTNNQKNPPSVDVDLPLLATDANKGKTSPATPRSPTNNMWITPDERSPAEKSSEPSSEKRSMPSYPFGRGCP